MSEPSVVPPVVGRPAVSRYNVVSRALVAPIMRWRARRIARALAPFLEAGETVLDFGTGDGMVARAIAGRTRCAITGLDTITYGDLGYPFVPYDGHRIPLADSSFDAAMALFVLHHCADPDAAIAECARVVRRRLLIIEEVFTNRIEEVFTKAEDWVANRILSGEVDIPLRFRALADWRKSFSSLGLAVRREVRFRPLPFIPLRTVLFELEKARA